MNKKSEKKKSNIEVVWPKTPTFTIIEDLFSLNPDQKHITLRVRLQTRIDAGEIVEIGSISGRQGRPPKVFAYTPVTDTVLAKAKSDGVTLLEQSRLQKLCGSTPAVVPLLRVPTAVTV